MAPYDERLLTAIVDDYAINEPSRIYCAIPHDDDDLSKGFREVTYKEFSEAIDRLAWWLDEKLGKTNGTFPTFNYFGPRDVRYPIFILAAMKSGRKALVPSHLASRDAHVFLAQKNDCQAFLYSQEFQQLSKGIRQNLEETKSLCVPTLEELLDGVQCAPYHFKKTLEEVREDPVVIVHTSGSTGMPKPVTYAFGSFAMFHDARHLPKIDGRNVVWYEFAGHRSYCSIPPYHSAGIVLTLCTTIFTNKVIVWGPRLKVPSAAMVSDMIIHGRVEIAAFSPALLQDVASTEVGLAQLKGLKGVAYGGAPLASKVGDQLSKFGNLYPGYGSTEAVFWLTIPTDPEDWQYCRFHPAFSAVLERQTGDLHELVIKRTPESETYTNLFRHAPNATEWRMSDLFTPHPTKPDLWRYSGRTDDLIPLTGEVKVYGAGIEEDITNHPLVTVSLVGGIRRRRPFLMIQPVETLRSESERENFLDEVWPTVEKVNARNFAAAEIKRGLTMVASPDKPFLKTAKGSWDRRGTFALYEKEIDAMYAKYGEV